MDWNALGAWLYEDSVPNFAKLGAHKIKVVYIDPRSGNAAATCSSLRANGFTPGIYYVPQWFPGPTPQEHAKKVSDYVQVQKLVQTGEPVMLDLEALSTIWVTAFLKSYRQHLPTRPTAYTNAPFQNETVVPVDVLQQYGLHWYPQMYYGDMSPADPAAVMLEVTRIYPPEMVHPFYDGACIPADARDGCVFTCERIP
jgi:hypothetical protein